MTTDKYYDYLTDWPPIRGDQLDNETARYMAQGRRRDHQPMPPEPSFHIHYRSIGQDFLSSEALVNAAFWTLEERTGSPDERIAMMRISAPDAALMERKSRNLFKGIIPVQILGRAAWYMDRDGVFEASQRLVERIFREPNRDAQDNLIAEWHRLYGGYLHRAKHSLMQDVDTYDPSDPRSPVYMFGRIQASR